MNRPETNEYAAYYEKYVSKVGDGSLTEQLAGQPRELYDIFEGVPEEKGAYAYADGKWTIKELLSHIIDGERIFFYRILRISRGDKTPIEGFEQDDYIANSNANNRTFRSLLGEFEHQRVSNLLMLENISDENSLLIGTASDNPVSVRALAYITAGHFIHHLRILKERYLA